MLVPPLLVADLLFLGGAGMTLLSPRFIGMLRDLKTLQERTFYGKEKKSLAYVIAIMNMILHGITAPNSGLSITVWDPVMGAIPPLSEADWEAAFAAYQTTIRSYQAYIRETLSDLWRQHREAMPARHLEVSDPIVSALMNASTPSRDES